MTVKTVSEIKKLDAAAGITVKIFKDAVKKIKPGISEIDIAREIENRIKAKGLKRSFRTIVASGPNAAKPHARPGRRRVKKNDMVVVDFGVIYKGCHSDFTRTVKIGRPGHLMRKFYCAVRRAQGIAIKKTAAGVRISDLAALAHDYMRKKGFGKYIMHTLGHGVGARIHEPPKLSEKNRRLLKENTVITIEPGLYAKGVGGVRIEDMVQVKKNRARILTG